jgi:hypothetical protein
VGVDGHDPDKCAQYTLVDKVFNEQVGEWLQYTVLFALFPIACELGLRAAQGAIHYDDFATNADMVWFGVIATATALGDLHSFRREYSLEGRLGWFKKSRLLDVLFHVLVVELILSAVMYGVHLACGVLDISDARELQKAIFVYQIIVVGIMLSTGMIAEYAIGWKRKSNGPT